MKKGVMLRFSKHSARWQMHHANQVGGPLRSLFENLRVTPMLASLATVVMARRTHRLRQIALIKGQLNDCLNSKGERLTFVLNNLLNDCGCSKPNS